MVPTAPQRIVGWIDALTILLSRAGGVIVAFAAVAIVGLLIMPIPPALLDFLLGINIAISATLLVVALWIPDAARFPSFPTILLLTTLYRLALNVCSTRLILIDAHAGQIIQAFGEFVVGGNYIVGGVMFLILTLIQFIVISKGSERVAEVSARFTLDAMAGKQMAIDADLRSGLMTPDEARQRRRALDSECRLYGAMDGAMKFVKGDAIAGIVISLVNIFAGIAIGATQMGLTVGEAIQTFSLLTIGDGLVAQIPALLISTAAGVVVTRVAAAQEGPTQAGRDIVEQVLGQPAALACVSLTLLVLGLFPGTGLPTHVFLIGALVLGTLALPRLPFVRLWLAGGDWRALAWGPGALGSCGIDSANLRLLPGHGSAAANGAASATAKPVEFPACPTPAMLVLGPELYASLAPAKNPEKARVFESEIERIRLEVQDEMGIEYPPVVLRRGGMLAPDGYQFRVFENVAASGRFPLDKRLVMCPASDLTGLGLSAEEFDLPHISLPACVISADQASLLSECASPLDSGEEGNHRPLDSGDKGDDRPLARSRGHAAAAATSITARTPGEVILDHFRAALRAAAADFFGIQELQQRLDQLEKTHPDLVEAVTPKPLPPTTLTAVLQRLVRERIGLRDFRAVLQAVAKAVASHTHPVEIAESVRFSLKDQIWRLATGGHDTLLAFRLSEEIEEAIAASRVVEWDRVDVTLDGETRRAIVEAIRARVRNRPMHVVTPVIVTRRELRPFVQSILCDQLQEALICSDGDLQVGNDRRLTWIATCD